jgi:hypothetical protein
VDQEKIVLDLRERIAVFLDSVRPTPLPQQVIAAMAFQIGHIVSQGFGLDAEGKFLDGFNELMERVTGSIN